MRAYLFFAFLLFLSLMGSTQNFQVRELRVEGLVDPLGIDVAQPRFSWQGRGGQRGGIQEAYQVLVASSLDKLNRQEGDVWNSGRVAKPGSMFVPYAGPPLKSRQSYYWKVKVWTNGKQAAWSNPARFSTGLFQQSEWTAQWIGINRSFPWDSVSKFARLSARYHRKEFRSARAVRRATAYVSGLGLYEFYLNGSRIGDQVLAPAPTDYDKTVLYNSFDVTSRIRNGSNAIGIVLGNGRFFTMRQNYKPQKWHNYGLPRLRFQLEIEYVDGTRSTIISDSTWKATADGPIRTANEYDGEEYDATKELGAWTEPGFPEKGWLAVDLMPAPGGRMRAQMNPPMKVMDTVKVRSIQALPGGRYILDLGQNFAGWPKIRVRGNRGDTVSLRFAESLQPDGSLYLANLRDAIVTDKYVLKGGGKEEWAPRFVYHGFRFVEVQGLRQAPSAGDFLGEVVYDDLGTIGRFTSSNRVLNAVHRNAYWGILSNYKGMPVDCPQRNERQPWLGDRTIGALGESYLFQNHALYVKWLQDIEDAQRPEGAIPDVAPSFWYYYKDNMTWPGAFLTIADMVHQQYGDEGPIRRHYPAMKKWMGYMQQKYRSSDYLMTKDNYGDWCVPPEAPHLIHSRDSTRTTDPKLIATAYYFYLLQLIEEFATINGQEADAQAFAEERIKVREAFNRNFYHAEGYYGNNTVTANLLPLRFGIADAGNQEAVFKAIIKRIEEFDGGHISTGVIGTSWLMRELSERGRSDLAYRLASNDTYPSWGYMVKNGATTIWELWNGNTANPEMNSQNHVMLLGDLLPWIYRHLGGIRGSGRSLILRPEFGAGPDSVSVSYQSAYGPVVSNWKRAGRDLTWTIEVPFNTKAVSFFPTDKEVNITEKGSRSVGAPKFLYREGKGLVYELGAGRYTFTIKNHTIR